MRIWPCLIVVVVSDMKKITPCSKRQGVPLTPATVGILKTIPGQLPISVISHPLLVPEYITNFSGLNCRVPEIFDSNTAGRSSWETGVNYFNSALKDGMTHHSGDHFRKNWRTRDCQVSPWRSNATFTLYRPSTTYAGFNNYSSCKAVYRTRLTENEMH